MLNNFVFCLYTVSDIMVAVIVPTAAFGCVVLLLSLIITIVVCLCCCTRKKGKKDIETSKSLQICGAVVLLFHSTMKLMCSLYNIGIFVNKDAFELKDKNGPVKESPDIDDVNNGRKKESNLSSLY